MVTENILFSSLTTLRIGGPIKYLVSAVSQDDIFRSIKKAKSENSPFVVIGGGSDLLVSDDGFSGYVVQNLLQGIEEHGGMIKVGSGTDLQFLVGWAGEHGLSGFEKLAGIPGTVGGAVYGNAGAYGQVISDYIVWVEVISPDGKSERLRKEECRFGYRYSKFKKEKFTILGVGFGGMPIKSTGELKKTSMEIVETRLKKYPAGIACPGSFFKNVEIDNLSQDIVKNIPADKIIYGKIPAGWLLEVVGAKGAVRGGVKIAEWHGNLFMNIGGGKARDFIELAREQKRKVKEKFGIDLFPEVQFIGFEEEMVL